MQQLLTQVASLTVWLVLLTVIFVPLERLFAVQPKRLRARTIRADLAYYFISGVAPALALTPPLALATALAQAATPSAYPEFLAELPLFVKMLIGFVVAEIGAYWGHRLSHEIPFLWRFHKVHHSPESLDWLVNTRAHPVDLVFTRLCGLAPLYLLSLGTSRADGQLLPLVVTALGTFWSFFVHANLKWRFGPLEWLVSTPVFHHWHHTNDEYRDHNYAALFPFVDKMFGTLHLPRAWPTVYGVDEPVRPALIDQMLDPLAPTAARPAADGRAAPPAT